MIIILYEVISNLFQLEICPWDDYYMSINYLNGDVTEPIKTPAIIVHVCNDQGAWGKGFVLAISAKWKRPEAAYRDWYKQEFKVQGVVYDDMPFELGNIQLVSTGDNIWIANMIAQHDFYRKGDHKGKVYLQYDALKTSLDKVNSFAKGIQGVSIHMPRIGCGLAGGTWDKVQEVIEECKLSETYVYDFD